MSSVSYLGPKEIAVNQGSILVGTFDPSLVSAISLVAEDKYPLPITIDGTLGIWYSSLEKGLNQIGIRSLRLKGTNKAGQVISEQVIKILVANATSNEPIINAIPLRETFFKIKPADSSSNNQRGKKQKENERSSIDN